MSEYVISSAGFDSGSSDELERKEVQPDVHVHVYLAMPTLLYIYTRPVRSYEIK